METKTEIKVSIFLVPSVEDLKKSLYEGTTAYFGISNDQGVDLVGVKVSSITLTENSIIRVEGCDKNTCARISACYNMKKEKKPKGEIVFH